MDEKVVIYRLGSLGDTVAALPAFHLVRRLFPDAERIALTNVPVSSKAAPLESILRDGGFIHRSIPYPVGLRDPVALARLALRLRRLGATTLVYMTETKGARSTRRDVAYFRWACGFRRIVGAPLTDDLATLRVSPDGEIEREVERLARTLADLGGIDLSDRSGWDLRLTAAEREEARTALGPVAGQPRVVVNTGGKAAQKDWGEPNWERLLAALSERLPGDGLVFVGAGEDSPRAARLGEHWESGPVVDLCGKVSPRVSGAAMEGATLFVGHDSGPLHLADAVGTPAIGLFGDFNRPKEWHPCSPATYVIHRTEGMQAIAVDDVTAAAGSLLSTSGVG
jgi:heptosyltransferase III